MAMLKTRGNSHNVIYTYKDEQGKIKQQWETYATETEAIQRKAFIEYLKKFQPETLAEQAFQYRHRKDRQTPSIPIPSEPHENNLHKTYGEFIRKWLPYRAIKKGWQPTTYDTAVGNFENHILPYFGDKIANTITSENIDDWLDWLFKKPCKGSKSYGKKRSDIPMLSYGSVKKYYSLFCSSLVTAHEWGYISRIPASTAPKGRYNRRKAWKPQEVRQFLEQTEDDKIIHLLVHLAFVGSLRESEVAAININQIDLSKARLFLSHTIERVSEASIQATRSEVAFIYPKEKGYAHTVLVLKDTKTEKSVRKMYLTAPLALEISERIEQIREDKLLYGRNYHDYGLLVCKPDGRPFDPKWFNRAFKRKQAELGILPKHQIEFQGLRKSGQMHKIRLSANDFQLVAEAGGQSPAVLMEHYNESLEEEKKNLSLLVESDFYHDADYKKNMDAEEKFLIQVLKKHPEILREFLHNSQFSAPPNM